MSPVRRAKRWRLVACALAAGLMLMLVFYIRARQTATTDAQLCRVIRSLVTTSGRPPANAPGYYADHPAELNRGQQQYDRALELLDCAHLPSGDTP